MLRVKCWDKKRTGESILGVSPVFIDSWSSGADRVIEKADSNLSGLFVDWLLIGLQSFGGGSSTFILIHQIAMKRRWLTEEEFVRAWALVQIAPGINLLKLTVMIGYRLGGWLGVVAAMSGLLLPSAIVTVLMTAGFTTIREITWVQSMTKGILPAAIGLSLAMGAQMAQPIFSRARKEGAFRLGAHFVILIGAALLLCIAQLSPVIVLLIAGIAAIILLGIIPRAPKYLTEQK